ncbi:MAG: protein kinase [Planctomycetota bacterium]
MQAGERVGGFILERPLGEGGMGAVWLARDPDGAEVALKLMRDVDEHFERFAREVEVLESLDHPGIVAARSRLEREGERVFYAMDYVPGRSLETLLGKERALGPRAAVELTAALLDALAAAHAAGVVHRDVKPGNVLVDPEGVPRLVDFGLALAQDRSRLTQAGTIMGTPTYMSPEQVRGAEAGPPSDLYAVGALLFELLSGRPPFVAQSAVALLRMHLDDEPPDLGTLVPGLDAGLVAVVTQALAKDPARRPPSAEAMAAALRALGAQAGTASTVILQARLAAASTRELQVPQRPAPPPSEAETQPPARRGRAPLIAGLLALPLLVGLALTLGPDPGPSAAGLPPPAEVELELLNGARVRGTLEAIRPEQDSLVLKGPDGALTTLASADVVTIRHLDPAPAGQPAPSPDPAAPR